MIIIASEIFRTPQGSLYRRKNFTKVAQMIQH